MTKTYSLQRPSLIKKKVGAKKSLTLHAVQGKPPSIATGRVGAVGQIHFICTVSYNEKHHIIVLFFLRVIL